MDINWHSVFFYFFALLTGGFAVAVVASQNIVRMACWLVAALGAVAGLFFLAGAEFLGAVQLLVYVGGTMVLLVFGVMLTARGPFVSMKTGPGQWLIALLSAGALLVVLLQVALGVNAWAGPNPAAAQAEIRPASAPLGLALLGVRVDQLEDRESKVEGRRSKEMIDSRHSTLDIRPSSAPVSGYLLIFELLSIHLFVVLIGAAYLARARGRVSSVECRVSSERSLSRPSTLDPRPTTNDQRKP
ncbi:MAG: NADH-quinone oxidoreductase subunit J [Pirellulales bacterium]|nr:NADH-quinone oxidoreductase subunit J [Pirellulales bacterium]